MIKILPYQDPILYFQAVSHLRNALLLDSADAAKNSSERSRYSYIAFDPFDEIIVDSLSRDAFDLLQKQLSLYTLETNPELPPFQGGAAGFFSYDLCQQLDEISKDHDDMHFPLMHINLYDVIISFDHLLRKAWIVSTGITKDCPEGNEERAVMRIDEVFSLLNSSEEQPSSAKASLAITSNFSEKEYCDNVTHAIEYIAAGDIFEVNLSQQFRAPLPSQLSPYAIYTRLREINPAPFAAFLNLGDTVIASASPERFLKLGNGVVETRPIKGTRSRGKTEEEDKAYANELMNSEKDKAENIMIVDLMRNDLSRVCEATSVHVQQLCELESYPSVHHLVSAVTGKLKENNNAIDLLKASFPGGSITGAPKIRAMQIISELEKNARGPYCGAIGFIGFDGAMDTSIVIRTFCIKDNIITYQSGGAIVLNSDPLAEYQETLTKSEALTQTLLSFGTST